jgi:cell division septal protein FtsQ
MSRYKPKPRRATGLVPRVAQGLFAGARWAFTHPKPFALMLVLAGLAWSIWAYAQHAEPFRITQVILPADSPLQLRTTLIGENLLKLDVRALAEELRQQQPALKQVRVVRVLPNALRIEPLMRIPVAQVKLDAWYLVDAEGFVLPEGKSAAADRFVKLGGFDKANAVRAGRENGNERLQLALRVLSGVRLGPGAVSRQVTAIDVSDPQGIRLTLDDGTEVRCGSEEELGAHLSRLQAALKAIAKQESMDVGYIDVRFQEPVLGPRT